MECCVHREEVTKLWQCEWDHKICQKCLLQWCQTFDGASLWRGKDLLCPMHDKKNPHVILEAQWKTCKGLRKFKKRCNPPDDDAYGAHGANDKRLVAKILDALNYKCPKCDQILDSNIDGCCAVHHQKCDVWFCWICWNHGFPSSQTTHDHVRQMHGDVFVPQAIIKQALLHRQAQNLERVVANWDDATRKRIAQHPMLNVILNTQLREIVRGSPWSTLSTPLGFKPVISSNSVIDQEMPELREAMQMGQRIFMAILRMKERHRWSLLILFLVGWSMMTVWVLGFPLVFIILFIRMESTDWRDSRKTIRTVFLFLVCVVTVSINFHGLSRFESVALGLCFTINYLIH